MKKFLAILTAITVMFSVLPIVSASASETTVTDSSEHSQGITVSVGVSSTYYVSIPADFSLALQETPVQYNAVDYSYTADYAVGVKGNIATGKKVYVRPGTLTLRDEGGSGENEVTVEISQPKTEWTRSDLLDGGVVKNSYTNTEGHAYANITYAGAYSGTLTFTFGLSDE